MGASRTTSPATPTPNVARTRVSSALASTRCVHPTASRARAASSVATGSVIRTRSRVASANVSPMDLRADPPSSVVRARATAACVEDPPASSMGSPATLHRTAATEFVKTISAALDRVCPLDPRATRARSAAWASCATEASAACRLLEMQARATSIRAAPSVRNASWVVAAIKRKRV